MKVVNIIRVFVILLLGAGLTANAQTVISLNGLTGLTNPESSFEQPYGVFPMESFGSDFDTKATLLTDNKGTALVVEVTTNISQANDPADLVVYSWKSEGVTRVVKQDVYTNSKGEKSYMALGINNETGKKLFRVGGFKDGKFVVITSNASNFTAGMNEASFLYGTLR